MIKLFAHQWRFVNSLAKIVVLRGGYGAGKTFAAASWALGMARLNHPVPVMVVEPVFSQIERVFVPTIEQICRAQKIRCQWISSKKEFSFWLKGRRHVILCASATNPETIKGFNGAAILIDEFETCPESIYQVCLSRLRDARGKRLQLALVGTPEGYGWGYEQIDQKDTGAEIILATSHDNKSLPKEYLETLKRTMSVAEYREKVMGLRTAKEGVVYTRWDRTAHSGKPPSIDENDSVEIWADFNVGKMAWCFAVWRKENGKLKAYVWRELIDENTDTLRHGQLAKQVMASELTSLMRRHVSEQEVASRVVIVCDASGNARNTASQSDIGILYSLGFRVWFPNANPRVKDRVQSVQMALANGQLMIDIERAPYIAKCIESQPYNRHGEPDKDPKRGLDHGSDAVGYGVYYRLPARCHEANAGVL